MVGTNNIAASNRRVMKKQLKKGLLNQDDDFFDEDETGVVTAPIAPLIKAQKVADRAQKQQEGKPAVLTTMAGSKRGAANTTTTTTSAPVIGKKRPAVQAAPVYPDEDEFELGDEEEEDEDFDDEEEEYEEGEWDDEDEEEEDDDGMQFDDVDDDDGDDYGDDLSSIHDDDDFETKAMKHKAQMLRQAKIAGAEEADDRARAEPARPFQEMAERSQYLQYSDTAQTGGAVEGMEGIAVGAKSGGPTSEELKDRISETVRVLSNFGTEREEDRTREEYLELLRADLIEFHEYNEFLMDRIMEIFPPHEAVEFLEAMEKERPLTLRVNTLKAKRRDLVQNLTKRGISIEPLEKWTKVGLQVFDHKVNVGATMEYLAGHYMVQAAASFLPVMALAPQENEKVLDMAAAPGGKTTHICQIMKNSGIVVANDVSAARCKSLAANILRLGITNCIVTNYDGVGFQRVMHHFDRILLDAPCTGTGVISRDKSIKTSKELADVQRVSLQQRRLLLEAIDCVKTGGVVVYSTCSFLVEENEAVVEYARTKRDVEVVEMGLPFGRPGFTKYRHNRFHQSVEHTRRYFPHVHNMDGFYVAKIRKISDKGCTDLNTINKSEEEVRQQKKNEKKEKLDAKKQQEQQQQEADKIKAQNRTSGGKKKDTKGNKSSAPATTPATSTAPPPSDGKISRPPTASAAANASKKGGKGGAPPKKKQRRQ